MTDRPDGRRVMRAGKLALITGVLAALVNSFSDFAPGLLAYRPVSELLSMIGLLGIFLGGMAWLVGYIVFAISCTARDER